MHPCRTPALDLAQQAQIAACNYLGYSPGPHDFSNSLGRQQGLPFESSRPLELHMHHHHHHYIASPTSPFSQCSSQYFEGPVSEVPATAANELSIRVASPVPASTTSTATTATYPALGLNESSGAPPAYLNDNQAQGSVQSPSQSLMHGTSVGDVEATQRYLQNVLWLKNQIDDEVDQAPRYGQEQRLETKVENEREMTGRDAVSPEAAPLRSIVSERQPSGDTKRCMRPPDLTRARKYESDDDAYSAKSMPRKVDESLSVLEKYEKPSAFSGYHSPYNSPSEDNSVTEDNTPALRLAPTNSQRNPRFVASTARTRITSSKRGEGTKGTIETPGVQILKSQSTVKSGGCVVCPSWSKPRGRELKLNSRECTPCEDTSSSLDDESFYSSGKILGKKSAWTGNSSCTGSESQQMELSPPGRPAKKSCGARASRRQASREARAWDTIEKKPPKRLNDANLKPDQREEPVCVYEMDTGSNAEQQATGNGYSYVPEKKLILQDRCNLEKERGDADNSRAQGPQRQIRAQPGLQVAKEISVTENAEIAWTPSLGSKRGLQEVLGPQDKNGIDKPRLDDHYDEEPCNSFSPPRSGEDKSREHAPHNRLREAVEAAWKTSLGTKRGLEDNYVKMGHCDRRFGDICKDKQNLNVDVCREQNLHGQLKERTGVLVAAEEKVLAYEEVWKATLGAKKEVGDDYQKKERSDPVFRGIHKDHENLKALVAREESLQRELKDQTVARVAAEERARVAAEQKAHIYEASAKAAEEGLRVLLDERSVFHSKFKEELEQGATDRLRLQELLQLEKLKLEATEGELREVRRSFQDSLAVGTRASKNSFQDPRLDTLSVYPAAPQPVGAGNDEARLRLMAESESRIAAEAKASYFEASAKAAEERLRSLLDERNWFYSRFKEELEHNNTDMIRLKRLMELEKANHERGDVPRKMKLDVRTLVASSVANEQLDYNTEDGQGALKSELDDSASCHSRPEEESVHNDSVGHELDPMTDLEESQQELLLDVNEGQGMALSEGFRNETEPEISGFNKANGRLEENWMPTSSITVYGDGEVRHDTFPPKVTYEKPSIKNDKKRPLSPPNSARVRHWKPPNAPFSVTIERANVDGGETTTTFDICPGDGRFSSLDLEFEETPRSFPDNQLPAADSMDVKDDDCVYRNPSDLALKKCTDTDDTDGGEPMSLPVRWKKETKAELRRMIQEQELTWKIAEDAVEELGRRLELLEKYKMDIQDTLGRSRAIGNMDCFLTRLEEKLEDFPRGFNSLYNCPIYEGATGAHRNPVQPCNSPSRPLVCKDYEIQKLKAEISDLQDELESCRRTRNPSPKMKSGYQSFPRSPPSPIPPTAPMAKRDLSPANHLSAGHQIRKEDTANGMEQELPDDPFEEMKTIATPATRNGWSDYSQKKVDRVAYSQSKVDSLDHCDEFPPWREKPVMEKRGRVPIPDEENGEKISGPTGADHAVLKSLRMDSSNGYGQEDDSFVPENLNSDEGELQLLKTAVCKLSHIFWEQERKLKDLKGAENKFLANSSQSPDLRDFYLELLKGMSQQLGNLCHDLQAKNQSHEKLSHNCHQIDLVEQPRTYALQMDNLGAPLEEPQQQIEEGTAAHILPTEALESGVEQSFEVVGDQSEDIMAESENLRAALKASERKIEEEMNTNLFLAEKLESGAKYWSKVIEKHAEEVERKDQGISCAQQLNIQLADDMSQTEASLAELRSRYKGLVASLECQLEAARSEVTSLQHTVHDMKVEIESKETMVSEVKGDCKEKELQIQELWGKMQAFQSEMDASVTEKLELIKSLEAMKQEADEQHHHILELISINEDLMVFSQGKEDEIMALTETVKNLRQIVNEKTDEATKMSVQAVKFSQEVVEERKGGETYRLQCAFLKSKLEETEQELMAREDSVERLTCHLGKIIEGQDSILEEKETLLLTLNKANYKEHRMDDQVRQSKIIIQDLEEKLNSLDAEIKTARLEMANMKAKGQEALVIERQAEEMRNRVHQLEEEIMEKEGQISILKTSFPGEYSSTF